MTGRTPHYGLNTLGQGDSLSADGYKFTGQDRETIDYLLSRTEVHRHNGQPVAIDSPNMALSLTLSSSGGTLPPGTRIYYKFTWVEDGHESLAGPEAWVDTPAPIATPGSPTVVPAATGGTLLPGTYYYVVTAYKTSSTLETLPSNPNFVQLTGVAATNQATLTLPTKPAGATGFNIYVRKPGQSKYFWIASTTGTSYVHDGGTAQDCDRSIPTRNATNTSNAVNVSMPGATPTVPAGRTWKLYRTYTAGNYNRSLVTHVVEAVSEGSSVITPTFTDIGLPALAGSPPTSTLAVTNPGPIDLAEETTGELPVARVSDVPCLLPFLFPGAVNIGDGAEWVNNYGGGASVTLQSIDLILRPGSTPAAQELIVDAFVGSDDLVPAYTDLFDGAPEDRPRIEPGNERGGVTDLDLPILYGEILSLRVAQNGGGATPTDEGLSVCVWLRVDPPT